MSVLQYVPKPGEDVRWSDICAAFEWARAMHDTPQEPDWHAEGDVGIHTQMVLEELVGMGSWQRLGDSDRTATFLACLMHDIGKPEVTRQDLDERWTSRGHSRRGAIMAREILWRMDVPFELREQVCGLVLHHQWPFFLIDRKDRERGAINLSYHCRNDLLAIVAEADARGRIADGKSDLLNNIELFSEYVGELGCLNKAFEFPSSHSRFEYFRKPDRSPYYRALPEPEFTVTVLSGLPAAGKDSWLEGCSQPVISLDSIRRDMGIKPSGKQWRIVDRAKELAREFLRDRQSFAWNATNVSLDHRRRIIGLARDYAARVRIVYVEVGGTELARRNKLRRESVPQSAMERMLRRWEMPTLCEAHEVDFVVNRGG